MVPRAADSDHDLTFEVLPHCSRSPSFGVGLAGKWLLESANQGCRVSRNLYACSHERAIPLAPQTVFFVFFDEATTCRQVTGGVTTACSSTQSCRHLAFRAAPPYSPLDSRVHGGTVSAQVVGRVSAMVSCRGAGRTLLGVPPDSGLVVAGVVGIVLLARAKAATAQGSTRP
jgi:hypothetical protein